VILTLLLISSHISLVPAYVAVNVAVVISVIAKPALTLDTINSKPYCSISETFAGIARLAVRLASE
jgi:hypothetical protein